MHHFEHWTENVTSEGFILKKTKILKLVPKYSQVHKYWDIDTILTHNGFQMKQKDVI